jgi:molybdenum cofactor cytidylyltransferase
MVAGIILAGGRSTRMGRSKALLTTPDGVTFVGRLIRALSGGGVDGPLVVGRSDDAELQREVDSAGARFVVNPDADEGGQLSSLLAGLHKADRPGVRALMVTPVDAPMVTPETVSRLIDVFRQTSASIVRPRYQGRNGHPVIFSRELFDDLRHASPASGAKAVLRAHENGIMNVDVDDPGVIGDIDTPADYEKLQVVPKPDHDSGEPRERSEPAKRLARERVGESEGRSPSE